MNNVMIDYICKMLTSRLRFDNRDAKSYHFYDISLVNVGNVMQETRRQILEILRERNEATVDDIVADLELLRGSITSVTVRHHLAKLQEDGLVDNSQMLHRSTPGRPQYIYVLTEQGNSFFPNNYHNLAANLLKQMKSQLPQNQVNVIIEGVADAMASEANIPQDRSLRERMDKVVEYLNTQGYEADWDVHKEGFVLNTHNCPYHDVEHHDDTLCQMDMRLISSMLGVVPRLLSRISDDDEACSYLIPQH